MEILTEHTTLNRTVDLYNMLLFYYIHISSIRTVHYFEDFYNMYGYWNKSMFIHNTI